MIAKRMLAFALPAPLAAGDSPPAQGPIATAPHSAPAPEKGLRIGSRNLEFLAENDGTGCRPRDAADYAEMRRIAIRSMPM